MLDGCSRVRIFRHLFLPLSKPPFVVMGITAFLAYWNSYVWPILTITSPDRFVGPAVPGDVPLRALDRARTADGRLGARGGAR